MVGVNITDKLVKSMAPYPRTIGRYSASEVYFIVNGLTTPEQWLNPPERTVKEMITMWNGTGMHNQIQGLLGGKNFQEEKRVVTLGKITVVGKADFLPENKNEVWEFKTSDRRMKEAKPWALHQTQLYCTMFEKETGRVFQPLVPKDKSGIYLGLLGEVKRDDAWFDGELSKLETFHEEVLKLVKS